MLTFHFIIAPVTSKTIKDFNAIAAENEKNGRNTIETLLSGFIKQQQAKMPKIAPEAPNDNPAFATVIALPT